MMSVDISYIASLDIGTTTIKCHIFDSFGNTVGKASAEVEVIYPKPGHVEIQAECLWNTIVSVMKHAITDSGLSANDIKCLGLSSQRCTFITWNKKTGECYHNLITWKDLRADDMVKELNNSYVLKAIRLASKCIYSFSRSKRYLAGSLVKFLNPQVAVRLMWVLKNVEGVSKAVENGDVQMGTMDTWVLFKLTGGKSHVTDLSCASATGFFDPFVLSWSGWALKLLGIPSSILPAIVDSAGPKHFGVVDPSILGASIPITASVADQSAASFGLRCFNVGDMKITLGTGTFLNVNTGKQPHASLEGLYPVIGWKFKEELVYLAEVASNDTGTLAKWTVESGLLEDVRDSDTLARSIEDNGGVYFVPAFSGIQAPIHDSNAGSGFIGIRATSKQAHLVRAILESIVYRVVQLYDIFVKEMGFTSRVIRVDGGVSQNDFISQFLADVTSVPVERSESSEMSVLGAAYLAGLGCGIWKDKEELYSLKRITHEFIPRKECKEQCQIMFSSWRRAVDRFLGWYSSEGRSLYFRV